MTQVELFILIGSVAIVIAGYRRAMGEGLQMITFMRRRCGTDQEPFMYIAFIKKVGGAIWFGQWPPYFRFVGWSSSNPIPEKIMRTIYPSLFRKLDWENKRDGS
jgi:hypothetical protein